MSKKNRSVSGPQARVLLLGAGLGEATCGILYLGGFLRRHGIEAWVRLFDDDENEQQMKRSLGALLQRVQPTIVGISLKWFNHLSRGLLMAKWVRKLHPEVRIVVGGNCASWFWKELSSQSCIDDILLGDGERPLLALARGEAVIPNCVSENGRPPLQYVQGPKSDEVFYSHFDDLFLSGADAASFSGWIQPGKGCSENCVYCGGTRGMEQASFGRPTSFLRPAKAVAQDHAEVMSRTWQLRYDYAGGTAEFFRIALGGRKLPRHSATYFLWGVPPPSLVETLAETFSRVYLVLDIGCFSQSQRGDLIRRGLLKPCPTDAELIQTVKLCARYPNLKLEVCGIAGLPHLNEKTLAEEVPLVEQLLSLGIDIGCQRLESQPGALVTQHADRFGMVADAHTFDAFVKWFAAREHRSDGAFPMVRFKDVVTEALVEHHFRAVLERIQPVPVRVDARTRLQSCVVETHGSTLGEWLGSHRAPPALKNTPLKVLRSVNGAGLALAPSLQKPVANAAIETGQTARSLEALLRCFDEETTVVKVAFQLRRGEKSVRAEIEALHAAGFVRIV